MQEQYVPAFANLMRQSWLSLVAQEGTIGHLQNMAVAEVGEDDEPPCPACGTAAPLIDGACSDCGLQLA